MATYTLSFPVIVPKVKPGVTVISACIELYVKRNAVTAYVGIGRPSGPGCSVFWPNRTRTFG